MSSRQSREKERSRLRMDNYGGSSRSGGQRGRPSPPRRREVDNVVKKARKETSGSQRTYWDKKILEAEEKDPNRWRHSGFKELYLEDPAAKKDRDSSRSRSRSPVQRARSPTGRARSPPSRARSPPSRARSPPSRARSPPSRARSPPSRARSPPSRARSPGSRRSPANGSKSRNKKPTTPPPRRSARSESVSSGSLSSCSDSQCSVCLQHVADSKDQPSSSAREKRPPPPKEPKLRPTARSPISRNLPPRNRSRSRSFSVPRSSNPVPVVKEKPRKKAKKRDREKKKKEKQARAPTPIVHIKQESFSDDSSSPSPPTPRMTLSERFGKMAQWSVDRDLKNHRNLRITSGGLDRTLTVEMDEPPSPPMSFQPRPPASNHALMEDGSWDDVRVRYAYYKEQGYLRDLSLSDYIKWEEWWYKYQDWLDNERYFEARAAHAHPHARRRPPRPTLSITPPSLHSLPPHHPHPHAMPPM